MSRDRKSFIDFASEHTGLVSPEQLARLERDDDFQTLNPSQKEAVKCALNRRLTLIQGVSVFF